MRDAETWSVLARHITKKADTIHAAWIVATSEEDTLLTCLLASLEFDLRERSLEYAVNSVTGVPLPEEVA